MAIAMMEVPRGFQGAGIALSVRAMLTYLLEAGHEVTVLSCFQDPAERPFDPRLHYAHVPWRVRMPARLSLVSDLAQGRAMAAKLRTLPRFDVLDVQEANIAPPLFRVADAMGTRKVYSIRQTVLFGPRRFSRFDTMILRHYNLAAARAADRCIAMTEVSRDAYVACGLDPQTIDVVPDAMDTPVQRTSRARAEGGPRFLWVGRLYPGKAIEVAVRAARLVLDALPDARFDIVGSGVLRPVAEHLAGPEAGTRILFHGHVRDAQAVAKIRGKADVFFFTTVHEAFGRVLVEAMAQGLPCVATDIPVLREVMGDAGDYFPMNDAGALAQRLIALAQDPDRCRRYAKSGQDRVLRLFNHDTARRHLLASYARLSGPQQQAA